MGIGIAAVYPWGVWLGTGFGAPVLEDGGRLDAGVYWSTNLLHLYPQQC